VVLKKKKKKQAGLMLGVCFHGNREVGMLPRTWPNGKQVQD